MKDVSAERRDSIHNYKEKLNVALKEITNLKEEVSHLEDEILEMGERE